MAERTWRIVLPAGDNAGHAIRPARARHAACWPPRIGTPPRRGASGGGPRWPLMAAPRAIRVSGAGSRHDGRRAGPPAARCSDDAMTESRCGPGGAPSRLTPGVGAVHYLQEGGHRAPRGVGFGYVAGSSVRPSQSLVKGMRR